MSSVAITTELGSVALGMRAMLVEGANIWGQRKISALSLVRATRADLSDAAVVAMLPGGFSNSWHSLIRVSAGRLVAYVVSANAGQTGFYVVDDSDPAHVTYARKAAGFPAGNPDAALQNLACSDDGTHVWASSYGTKDALNPPYYIYHSGDSGETWAECYHHIVAANTHIHAICWDTYRSRIWGLVGDHGSGGQPGILYSDNYGTDWTFLQPVDTSYEASYMFTSITPMPDRVLFGTDRTPAGIVTWLPSGQITQTVFMQLGGVGGSNLGFAGRPVQDMSTAPYRIAIPFGNAAAYSHAWMMTTNDGTHWDVSNWLESPATDARWCRYLAGLTADGWLVGNSPWAGGNEYACRLEWVDLDVPAAVAATDSALTLVTVSDSLA